MVSQLVACPTTQEEVIAEVDRTYDMIVIMEKKCVEVHLDQAQLAEEALPGVQPELNIEQYQTFLDMHKTLLNEQYEFLLTSQHPSATPEVRRLPLERSMPTRLYRYAIHDFLELLRKRLPASHDYLLTFIHFAYPMMTLLLETVPAFESMWFECLGDLSRYRLGIERHDPGSSIVWAEIARQWYLKSANYAPVIGRLYYHLGSMGRPDPLLQLFYAGKTLAVPNPFTAARMLITGVFEANLNTVASKISFSAAIAAIVRAHAIIFTGHSLNTFDESLREIKSNLDRHITRNTKEYLQQGYCIAISNCIALLGYGADNNPLAVLLKPQFSNQDTIMAHANSTTESPSTSTLPPTFAAALRLFVQTAEIHLLRIGDKNTLSFLHVTLVFIRHVAGYSAAATFLFPSFPWRHLMYALNGTTVRHPPKPSANKPPNLASARDKARPLQEEWAMRGLSFVAGYFPEELFTNKNVDPETHYPEAESMRSLERPERVHKLGVQIAELAGEWMSYGGTEGKYASCWRERQEVCGRRGEEGERKRRRSLLE